MGVQTAIAGTSITSSLTPIGGSVRDIDYLAARLHGRRSRMAEEERLDALCRIRTLPELFRTLFPEADIKGIVDFQRLLVQELIGELSTLRACMACPGSDLLGRILVRFQVENLKVVLRACLSRASAEIIERYLVSLPADLGLNIAGLSTAESLPGFVRLMPAGLLQENLERALALYGDNPRSFFFEAALDRGYLQGLIAGVEELPREDREIIGPMAYQEADIFHLMLVARGKFYYSLTPTLLGPLHVHGTRIPGGLFAALLSGPDLSTSISLVAERVLDVMPSRGGDRDKLPTFNGALVEALAWKRFVRLANLAFRKGHMGLGAVMGYAALRRIEVANLITISEGIYRNMAPEIIRGRLIPRTTFTEVGDV